MQLRCPTCRREIDWVESDFRPFCSERCRLIDLGGWLAERHVIPAEALADDESAISAEQLTPRPA